MAGRQQLLDSPLSRKVSLSVEPLATGRPLAVPLGCPGLDTLDCRPRLGLAEPQQQMAVGDSGGCRCELGTSAWLLHDEWSSTSFFMTLHISGLGERGEKVLKLGIKTKTLT